MEIPVECFQMPILPGPSDPRETRVGKSRVAAQRKTLELGIVVLILFLCPAAWAAPQAKPTAAQAHYYQGDHLYIKGQLDAAIAEYRKAISLDPKMYEPHHMLGWALDDKGDRHGSIAEFLEAVRLNPDDADTYDSLASKINDKSHHESALAFYNEVLRLDQKNAKAHVGLGHALAKRKEDWDGAIKEYREALRLDPKNAKAHEYLGEALGAKGDRRGGIAEEREALRLNPGDDEARRILKDVLHGKEDIIEGTIDDYSNAISRYASLLGVVMGLFYFVKGFLVYRKLRVFEDTPESPIRSVAMGLNRIHGNSEGEQTVPGPVSRKPCYFYEVRIEKWQTDPKGGKHWSKRAVDADGVRFYLADATGRVWVDAHGAEFDLPQSGLREISTSTPSSRTDADKELEAYIERASPGSGAGRYRLTEHAVFPQCSYDVIGPCVENPRATNEDDRKLIAKGQSEKAFFISRRAEKEVEQKMRRDAAYSVFGGAGMAIACLVVFLVFAHWI
jgi:tetratricopeptide (TPR) repeat protein